MKTAIVIITYNIRSEIFILQVEALRKFCKDDFTIEIFDNSNNAEMAEAIRYHADRLGVNYTKVNSSVGTGSESHSWAAQFSHKKTTPEYDYYFYLDHDCIPVKNFSVQEILNGKAYAGIAQKTPTYIWPGCFMFNNYMCGHLIDFSPNHELQLDTGGGLYKMVEALGKEQGVFFSEEYCQNQHYQKVAYNHYSLINNTFIHFIAASNWNNIEDNDARINGLIAITKEKAGL